MSEDDLVQILRTHIGIYTALGKPCGPDIFERIDFILAGGELKLTGDYGYPAWCKAYHNQVTYKYQIIWKDS